RFLSRDGRWNTDGVLGDVGHIRIDRVHAVDPVAEAGRAVRLMRIKSWCGASMTVLGKGRRCAENAAERQACRSDQQAASIDAGVVGFGCFAWREIGTSTILLLRHRVLLRW